MAQEVSDTRFAGTKIEKVDFKPAVGFFSYASNDAIGGAFVANFPHRSVKGRL